LLALHWRDGAVQIFELSHPLNLRNSSFDKIPKFLVFTSPRQPQNRSKVQSVSHPILPDHRNNTHNLRNQILVFIWGIIPRLDSGMIVGVRIWPFKEAFPDLFGIAHAKDATIGALMDFSRDAIRWNVSLLEQLRIEMWMSLPCSTDCCI
jgi:hypothetical protein